MRPHCHELAVVSVNTAVQVRKEWTYSEHQGKLWGVSKLWSKYLKTGMNTKQCSSLGMQGTLNSYTWILQSPESRTVLQHDCANGPSVTRNIIRFTFIGNLLAFHCITLHYRMVNFFSHSEYCCLQSNTMYLGRYIPVFQKVFKIYNRWKKQILTEQDH